MNFLKLSVHVFCLAEKAKLRRTNSRTNCQQNNITVCRADDIPGVDVADVPVLHEPTGVDMGVPQANTPQVFDDAVFDTDLDGGVDAEPPTLETPADTPPVGMATRNVRARKPPEKFIPSMQENKYEIALAQITASLGKSKNALAFAQMSVSL